MTELACSTSLEARKRCVSAFYKSTSTYKFLFAFASRSNHNKSIVLFA